MNNNKLRIQHPPMPCLHIASKGPERYCAESLICPVSQILSSTPTLPLCALDAHSVGRRHCLAQGALNLAEQTHITPATLFAEKNVEALEALPAHEINDMTSRWVTSPRLQWKRGEGKTRRNNQSSTLGLKCCPQTVKRPCTSGGSQQPKLSFASPCGLASGWHSSCARSTTARCFCRSKGRRP